MPAKSVTREKEIMRELERILTERVNAATQLVRNEAVRQLNRSQATRRTKGGNIVGLDPSKPGEPPKRVSSRLIRDVQVKVEKQGTKIRGTVFTSVKYARRLELGFAGTDAKGRTVSQAPRPFLRPAFRAVRPKIKALLGRRADIKLPKKIAKSKRK